MAEKRDGAAAPSSKSKRTRSEWSKPIVMPNQKIIDLQKILLALKWSKIRGSDAIKHIYIVSIVDKINSGENIQQNINNLVRIISKNINKILKYIKKLIEECKGVTEQRLNLMRGLTVNSYDKSKPDYGNPQALGNLLGSYLEDPELRHPLRVYPEGIVVHKLYECELSIDVTADDLLNEFFDVYMNETKPEIKDAIRGLVREYQSIRRYPTNVEEAFAVDSAGTDSLHSNLPAAGGDMSGGRRRGRKSKAKAKSKTKKNKKSKKK